MTDHASKVTPVAAPARDTNDKHLLTGESIGLKRECNHLSHRIIKLERLLKACKQESGGLHVRLRRLRSTKLKLEQMIDTRDAQLKKAKESQKEIRQELKDRDRYIARQDVILNRTQTFIDKCTMRLGSLGRVPIVLCIDCRFKRPITDFKLRVPSSVSNAENWVVNAICRSCWSERNKRVDAKRRAIGIVKHPNGMQDVSEMAQQFVDRMPGAVIDKFAETIRAEEKGEYYHESSENRKGRVSKGNNNHNLEAYWES